MWLNILPVAVYDAIAYFNCEEKAAEDIIQLLQVNPGIHMTKTSMVVKTCIRRLTVYRMSEPKN